MLHMGIILGSTRQNRVGADVTDWVMDQGARHADITCELLDIKEFNLPMLDDPVPPAMKPSDDPHVQAWSNKIAACDGFVIVTPEYNHSFTPSLKNAIDHVYQPWLNKAAGFVSYGFGNGLRAVEQLRLVLANLEVATVRNQVALNMMTEFENFSTFQPQPHHEEAANAMFTQVIAWSQALKALRH